MTSISGSVYIDKLNDTYNEYNNANHTTIKMKPIDVNLSPLLDFNVEVMIRILNLNLVIM